MRDLWDWLFWLGSRRSTPPQAVVKPFTVFFRIGCGAADRCIPTVLRWKLSGVRVHNFSSVWDHT